MGYKTDIVRQTASLEISTLMVYSYGFPLQLHDGGSGLSLTGEFEA